MSDDAAAPRRTLGLTTATTIIVGSMIGSGILLLPADPTPLVGGGWHTGLPLPPYGQAFVAIALILLLTFVNYLGVRFGGLISNASTIAKALGLPTVVAIVLLFAHAPAGAFGPEG